MSFKNLYILIALASLFMGCAEFKSGIEGGNGGGDSASSTTELTSSTGDLGTMSASIDARMNLGEQQTFRINFTNATNYSGDIAFSIDRNALSSVQGQEDVSISLNPTDLTVAPGEEVTLILNISSPFQSPSFTPRQLKVIATGSGGQTTEMEFPLSVSAVVDIELNECEYQNNNDLDNCWNVPASIDLRTHSAGVTLRYTNCDPTSNHIVHGNGPINHQPVGQPLSQAASASNCAGTYTVQIAPNENGTGTYYMHDTQGNGQRRTINFGVQNPLAARAASVADSFDRGPSNAGSCHDPVGTD